MPSVSEEAVQSALATVLDPEIRRPITDLGMVKSVSVDGGSVAVEVYLTVASCPMQDTIAGRVESAVAAVPGVQSVSVVLDVMSDDQRQALRAQLQGAGREIPFNRPGNTTRILGISSGKGGVGKSSLTANLAVAMARQGHDVGVLDADIYGHSIPRILGLRDYPTRVEGMLMPPESHGVRAISMLMFKPGGVAQAVAYRGPMNHKLLQQFLTDVYWGDIDTLLVDLPPGTGDMAMSLAQLLPQSELLVVTTPQMAAADVAVRAGMMAVHTKQRIVGVVENMSALACPHCGEPVDLFGSGGGSLVAQTLSRELDTTVDVLARIPFDVRLREGGDAGEPLLLAAPDSPAAQAIDELAGTLTARPRGLAGMSLGITPASRF